MEREVDAAAQPGLCGECGWVRIVATRRGSRFHLCTRSRLDPDFPRYPRLPVLECSGWIPREGCI